MKIAVVGLGRVGGGLLHALSDSSLQVAGLHSAQLDHDVDPHDLWILTVPDACIADIAGRLALRLETSRDLSRVAVVHCAGAIGLSELSACRQAGASVGAFHPLVSFPTLASHPSLEGTTFTFFGDAVAKERCTALVAALQARLLCATTTGPRYHAAAAMVANGAAALVSAGTRIFESLNIERKDAELALGALLRTVADNIGDVGLPDALSGPVRRGDASTVERHRQSLDEEGRRAYDAMLPLIVDCAKQAGLEDESAQAIVALLDRRT